MPSEMMKTKTLRELSQLENTPISGCNSSAAGGQPLLPHDPKGMQSSVCKQPVLTVSIENTHSSTAALPCERPYAEKEALEAIHVLQVKKRITQPSITSVLGKRSFAEDAEKAATCVPQVKKCAMQSGIMDFLAGLEKKQGVKQEKSLTKSIESKGVQAVGNVVLNRCAVVKKPSDFFKPLSEKKQTQSTNKLTTKCLSKPEVKEKLPLSVDLQMEARLAAEENAQLSAGKPTHPFFSHQSAGLGAVACISNIKCAFLAPIAPSDYLSPAPPCHVNQLPEINICKAECQTGINTPVWCEKRKDQCVLTADLSVQALDILLRIPLSSSMPSSTSKSVSQHTTEELSLQPLESTSVEHLVTFLKELEKNNKHKEIGEEDNLAFSEGDLKERLKRFQSAHVKQSVGASLDLNPELTKSGSTSTNLLWTDIYQPRIMEQVFANTESVTSLSVWLQSWPSLDSPESDMCHQRSASDKDSEDNSDCSGDPDEFFLQSVLVLTGPVGCGKTAAIYACAQLHGYTVIEVNCSEDRSGPLIKQRFGESMESHRLGKWSADSSVAKELGEDNKYGDHTDRAILLLEDVDVLSEADRGFMAAVAQVAATAKRPIVLTTNDSKLCIPHNLHARLLEFKRPSTEDLVAMAYLVCIGEGFVLSAHLLQRIVNVCNHDARKLLNYLQFWCQNNHYSRPQLTTIKRVNVEVVKDEKEYEVPCSVKVEDGDPAAVILLFCFEVQHRLWPVYMSTSCHCDITKSVAVELAELVSKAERSYEAYQEKKLAQDFVRKRVLLSKRERRMIDSKSDVEVDLPFENDEESPYKIVDEESKALVSDLIEARDMATTPVKRKRTKRLLAMAMSDSDDDVPQKQPLQEGPRSPMKCEPLEFETSRDTDSIKSISFLKTEKVTLSQCGSCVEPYPISADGKTEIPHDKSSQSPTSICHPGDLDNSLVVPKNFQSTTAGVDNLWTNYRKCSKNKDVLLLSAASKDSLSSVESIWVLTDNLSACEIMSYMQCCGQNIAIDTFRCAFCENAECCKRLQVCGKIAHQTFQACLQNTFKASNSLGESMDALSTEDMLLAVNDPFTLGKLLATNEHCNHYIFAQAAPASEEHDLQRLRKRSSLQHSLSIEIPARAYRLFQGASFYECVSCLALMESLKHDHLPLGPLRRRTRFRRNHKDPWNLSQNSLNNLQSFGRFGGPLSD